MHSALQIEEVLYLFSINNCKIIFGTKHGKSRRNVVWESMWQEINAVGQTKRAVSKLNLALALATICLVGGLPWILIYTLWK